IHTQKLQQSPQSLIIQEGDELTISCNSSESLYALHWYRQGSDGGPTFLVALQKGGDKKNNTITGRLDEKMQQSFLHIQASQPMVNSQVLSQSAQYISIPEGKDVSMSCNSSSTLNNFLWYKQAPGEGLVLLVALYKSGDLVRNGKVTAEFGGTRKDSVLTISASEPVDTSTYFCAGQHSAPQAPAACSISAAATPVTMLPLTAAPLA
ncbi:hypothetical protein A6R68_01496, partial [Neotoma lepida]